MGSGIIGPNGNTMLDTGLVGDLSARADSRPSSSNYMMNDTRNNVNPLSDRKERDIFKKSANYRVGKAIIAGTVNQQTNFSN